MNDLSWFLYLADIVGTAKGWLMALSVSGIIAVAIWCLSSYISADVYETKYNGPKWRHLTVPALAAVISVFIPAQGTIYAIAASEMGEEILKSSTASKAQKALDAWLDKQIADEGEGK